MLLIRFFCLSFVSICCNFDTMVNVLPKQTIFGNSFITVLSGDVSFRQQHVFYLLHQITLGGWMRLLHSFVSETPPWTIASDDLRTDNITEWFQSNNSKYLSSPNGLSNLASYMEFDEIRFYCRTKTPGFVTHFKTLTNKRGFEALRYFRDSSVSTLPYLCNSFHAFDDDTTAMGSNCKYIGVATDGVNGHWSIASEIVKNRRLYGNTYMWFRKAAWGAATIRCYTHSASGNAKIKNGTFEITVR